VNLLDVWTVGLPGSVHLIGLSLDITSFCEIDEFRLRDDAEKIIGVRHRVLNYQGSYKHLCES